MNYPFVNSKSRIDFYYIVDKLTSGKNNAIIGLGEGARGDNHHYHNHGLGEGAWSDQECGLCVGGQRHVF